MHGIPHASRESEELVDRVQKQIDGEYEPHFNLPISMLLRTQYQRIFAVTEGLKTIAGKEILDIAGGANTREISEHYHHDRNRMYEPWFARFAAMCGANVMVMDKRKSNPDHHYSFMQRDFSDPAALELFKADSFDIVNNSAFLVAPSKMDTDAGGGMPTTPELYFHKSDAELEEIDDVISKQVMRILREGGYYLYNESIYQKTNGHFVRRNINEFRALFGNPPIPQRRLTK